jgi:hypothetical protein
MEVDGLQIPANGNGHIYWRLIKNKYVKKF